MDYILWTIYYIHLYTMYYVLYTVYYTLLSTEICPSTNTQCLWVHSGCFPSKLIPSTVIDVGMLNLVLGQALSAREVVRMR